jgi:hypothetical protein
MKNFCKIAYLSAVFALPLTALVERGSHATDRCYVGTSQDMTGTVNQAVITEQYNLDTLIVCLKQQQVPPGQSIDHLKVQIAYTGKGKIDYGENQLIKWDPCNLVFYDLYLDVLRTDLQKFPTDLLKQLSGIRLIVLNVTHRFRDSSELINDQSYLFLKVSQIL